MQNEGGEIPCHSGLTAHDWHILPSSIQLWHKSNNSGVWKGLGRMQWGHENKAMKEVTGGRGRGMGSPDPIYTL